MTILFSEKVLVQLNLTLVTKSDAYNDSSLRYIFRLNNSHYLLSALKRSGLLDLLKVRHKQFFKVVLVIFQIFRILKITSNLYLLVFSGCGTRMRIYLPRNDQRTKKTLFPKVISQFHSFWFFICLIATNQ